MNGSFKYILASALALMTLWSCSNKEDPETTGHDDAYYAEKASISSGNSHFTSSSEGGIVNFAAEGGSVNIVVDCGTDWTVENDAVDLFDAVINNAASLTITARQNTATQDVSATICLYTAASHIRFASITVIQDAYDKPIISAGTTSWRAPAVGDLTTEIEVSSSTGDWAAESSASWLSVEKTNAGVRLSVDENAETKERNAEVTLAVSDGVTVDFSTIAVTQDAKAYVALSKSTVGLYVKGDTSSVTVDSNYDWDFSCENAAGWLDVNRNGNVLTVSVTEDYDDENGSRQEIISLTSGDGDRNTAETFITVTEFGPQPDALIFQYTVTSAGTKIQLPCSGIVDCTVDWMDDSEIEAVTSLGPMHVYDVAGVYEVRVNGTVTALSASVVSIGQTAALTGVVQWGNTGLLSMANAFYECTGLVSLPDDTRGAFAEVTTFESAFANCSLATLPSGLFTYCSKVTTFYATFIDCTSLTTIPEGLLQNCTAVTAMNAMFYDCSKLSEIPADLFSGCIKNTTFTNTFRGCSSLKTVPMDLFANCASVGSFGNIFRGCSSLATVPKGLFDGCVKATSFFYAFSGCPIESIPDGLFDNCTKVNTFEGVFYGCKSLKSVPEGLFDHCGEATTFKVAFYNCYSLESVPDGLFDKCPLVTDFSYLFYECGSLEAIPTGLFDHCPLVTTFYAAFYDCNVLKAIPQGLFDNCPLVSDFSFAFYKCSIIESIPAGLFDKCPLVTTFLAAFYKCESLTSVLEGLFDNCPNVTDFEGVFYGCTNLVTVPDQLFAACTKVKTFNNTFYSCTALTGESPYNMVNGEKVHLYERTAGLGFTVPTGSKCFTGCTGLSDYSSIPSDWGGGSTTSSLSTGRIEAYAADEL